MSFTVWDLKKSECERILGIHLIYEFNVCVYVHLLQQQNRRTKLYS